MKDVIQALNSGNEAERIYAAQDIGAANDPELAIHLINRLIVEKSPLVKDAIVFSLMKMPCTRIYDHLFKLFGSSEAFLRNAAVSIFGSEKGESIGFLTAHLDHSNREVRKLILDALYATGTPEAILAIRAGLHDPSINVQITAVEYLGTLEDRGSVDDLIRLFQKKSEPMLRCAIMDALSHIGVAGVVKNIMSILGADKDINKIDPIYIPGVIRLASHSGDLDFICKIFETLTNATIYADDLIRAIGESKRRFKNILEECCILEMIVSMIKDSHLRDDVRYGAVELLLTDEKKLLNKTELLSLGKSLVSETSMSYAGVRLLALSNTPEGKRLIKKIMSETKDQELRSLCEELIEELSRKKLSAAKGGDRVLSHS